MKQRTLTGIEKYAKTMRRAQCLADIDKIISWSELAAAVRLAFPKMSERGGFGDEQCDRIFRLRNWHR